MKGDVKQDVWGSQQQQRPLKTKETGHMESMWQLYDATIKGFSQVKKEHPLRQK